MNRLTLRIVFAVTAAAALPSLMGYASTASAMPSDDPETMSCKQLWVARNAIYKDHGYCFKTKKAKKFFGNKGCYIDDETDVPLSKWERKTVATYRHWEIVNGC